MEFWTDLLDTSNYPPRWRCGYWTPFQGWLHISSDVAIFLAYFAIPLVLAYFLLRRHDLPFRKIVVLFLAFILCCGTTHLMEAIIFWWPAYRLAGVIKLLTAIVSWSTVFALVRVVPKVLAMRSPEELEEAVKLKTIDLETLLRATPVPIFIAHDAHCENVTGNAAACQLLGVIEGTNLATTSATSNVSRRFHELRGGQPLKPEDLPLQLATRLGIDVVGAELTYKFDDGEIRHFIGNAVPLYGQQGKVRGAIEALMDVTDLRHAMDSLRDVDRRKDEFLATLAHELRNPLAPIRNAVEILKLMGPGDAKMQRIRDMIDRQLSHLVRLVDDLLDLSRVANGKIQLQRVPVDMAQVVQLAVEANTPGLEERQHKLQLETSAEPLVVEGDPVRLTQILSNLLNNAIKYTSHEGELRIVARREGSHAVISLHDNGCGIAEEMLPKIFDMFTQADRSLHRTQGGLGIGLALVRKLVELHHGKVVARSPGVGLGSEFEVRLPLVVDQPVGPTVVTDQHEATMSTPSDASAQCSILVVDDNADAAESLSQMLSFRGHRVATAFDGPSGVEKAAALHPDIILLDLGMPGMDGFETARRIRALKDVHSKVVALTAWGQEEDRRRTADAGFDGHLVKPVDPLVLQTYLTQINVT